MRPVVPEFGWRLKSARRTKRREDGRPVTLLDISQKLGGVPSLWSGVENGELPCRFETLWAYADYLGVDIAACLRDFETVRNVYENVYPDVIKAILQGQDVQDRTATARAEGAA